jgi:hypothetical protein
MRRIARACETLAHSVDSIALNQRKRHAWRIPKPSNLPTVSRGAVTALHVVRRRLMHN